MTEITYTSDALFVGKDELVQTIYTRLLETMRTLGPFQEEPINSRLFPSSIP